MHHGMSTIVNERLGECGKSRNTPDKIVRCYGVSQY